LKFRGNPRRKLAFPAKITDVTTPDIIIPADLLPVDGRFGSWPTKVRPEALNALNARATDYMGTSHRRMPVRLAVAELRNGIAELLRAPDGYEVVLGNGGSTGFWDCAAFSLIEQRSHHLCFGEFSGKFARGVDGAPHLSAPSVVTSDFGTHPPLVDVEGVDAYCYPHNETSTGVMLDPRRVDDEGALMLVDATSAAGGLMFDGNATDAYYFAPQKALAGDGGLWIAMMSPAAVERVERLAASDRWIPPTLALKLAIDNSRKDQTYNTPSLATVFLTAHTVNWFNENGGLAWSAGRCAQSRRLESAARSDRCHDRRGLPAWPSARRRQRRARIRRGRAAGHRGRRAAQRRRLHQSHAGPTGPLRRNRVDRAALGRRPAGVSV